MGMSSRVVVSGIGVVSPIGDTLESFWQACLEGRSGARRLDSPWVTETGLGTRIAATVDGFDAQKAGVEPKLERLVDRTTLFALGAAREALEDAALGGDALDAMDRSRVATVIGSGIGGLTSLEVSHAAWREKRSKNSIKRYSLPMLIPNAPAGQVAIRFGATGECKSISTACAAGTMALGDGWRILQRGEADIVIAGGTDGVAGDADCYALLGFDRLRTLSTRNDEPERASRPFDRERDGFVLGEGAAVLVLEREDHAKARGARSYAAIAGYAANCDAHSMMQPDESGRTIAAVIEAALRSADVARDDVEYVSAHGTSTLLNDKLESKVLHMVFGSRGDDIPVTALKSMTGHCIGGSGPLETAAAVLSLDRGMLAPTINYEFPDPECNVDVVANEPRERRVGTCLKLSYGFGGHNGCLVLGRI
jgi:3-oxoacyl-[acyl-carrier-protein] synthase II